MLTYFKQANNITVYSYHPDNCIFKSVLRAHAFSTGIQSQGWVNVGVAT